MDPKKDADIEALYLVCKEGWIKSVLGEFHSQKQALSRFFLGAMILSDPVLDVVRRELRRVSPDVRIEREQIKTVLATEVIKREVMEGEKAMEAQRKISRSISKALRAKTAKESAEDSASCPPAETATQSPIIAQPPVPPMPQPPA